MHNMTYIFLLVPTDVNTVLVQRVRLRRAFKSLFFREGIEKHGGIRELTQNCVLDSILNKRFVCKI